MTSPTLDDVPVPGFEDRLWSELARVHSDTQRLPDASDPAAPAEAPLRRRARRSLLAGIGAAAAAATVVAAVAITRSNDDPAHRAGDQTETTPPDDATPGGEPGTPAEPGPGPDSTSIEAKIIAATDAAIADSVVHEYQDAVNSPGAGETWTDEQSGRMRFLQLSATGAPVFDTGPATAPGPDDVGPEIPPDAHPGSRSWPTELTRSVDYCFGEYVDYQRGMVPATNGAQRLRDQLARELTLTDGTQIVDGRELIRVFAAIELTEEMVRDPETWTPPPELEMELAPGGGAVIDKNHVILVDPTTYQPVMTVGNPGEGAEFVSGAESVTRFEYLPRTPENLALLSPPVPDGFVQIDAARGDGERFDRCGVT